MRDPVIVAREMAERKQRIIDSAFNLFTESSIEAVTMNDIALEAGIGIATVFRYYRTKTDLVMDVVAHKWVPFLDYLDEVRPASTIPQFNAIDRFELLLDLIIYLYKTRKDLLRFYSNFEAYIRHEKLPEEQLMPYYDTFLPLYERLNMMIERAKEDHTIRDSLTLDDILYSVLYPMLSTATKYSFGVVEVSEPEFDGMKHLLSLKSILMAFARGTM